jgi:hypothetical protein
MVKGMKIATVDSACSILDEELLPTNILVSVGMVVDLPYDKPLAVETRIGDYKITDPNLLVYELKLCEEILDKTPADCIHFDLSLGGVNILDVTDEYLLQIPLSPTGRTILHAIMPELQKIALSIDAKHHIPVLAIGKRSLPVRLAEIYAGAYGIAHAAEIARDSKRAICVGLPLKTLASFKEGKVIVTSEEPMEGKLHAEAPVIDGVEMIPFLNPNTRGFQVIKLIPQE